MPIWQTAPVEEQPHLTMIRWTIMRTPGGDNHLVGYCTENHEGRVSTSIKEVSDDGKVSTASGRIYQLRGLPHYDGDGMYVWNRWASFHEIKGEDVTQELAAILKNFLEAEQLRIEERLKETRKRLEKMRPVSEEN